MISRCIQTNAQRGLSLIVTLVIAAGASVLIGGVLFYTSSQTNLLRRIVQYDTSLASAVAATEKVVTRITKDYQSGGETTVADNLGTYMGLVPTPEDVTSGLLGSVLDPLLSPLSNSGPGSNTGSTSATDESVKRWRKFDFTDLYGQLDRTYVEQISGWRYGEVFSKYPGLRGYAANYCVISNVREKNRSFKIISAVRQDVQIASVPLCQFQFFYVPDMELNPSTPGLTLNGRVHCNGNMYLQPAVDVTFLNHVTASRRIVHSKHPADPVSRPPGRVHYRAERETGLNTLNLAIGTNAGPLQLRSILEAPEPAESPASLIARERFYNKADLVIVVSNSVVTGRSGSYNGGSVTVPWLATRGIVTRNSQGFYDQRECRDVKVTEVDVAKFAASFDDLSRLLGRPPRTLWIIDLGDSGNGTDDDEWKDGDDKDKGKGNDKPKDKDGDDDNDNGTGNNDKDASKGAISLLGGILQSSTVPFGAVRVRNAQTLPSGGLTIATPNTLYLQGAFNLNGAPACLAADAVTILSGNWADINGARTLSSRVATDTAVNAAIITGIVPTGGGNYSGGAENSLRLLEDWTGRTLTFKGAILVLYYSKQADAPWGGPSVYAPPTRAWSYDTKLAEAGSLPPSMPAARTVFRSDWTAIRPNSKI